MSPLESFYAAAYSNLHPELVYPAVPPLLENPLTAPWAIIDTTALILPTESATYTSAAGDSSICSSGGDNTITTGAGNSTVIVDDGNNTVTMGAGNNSISALNGNNTFTTGAGDSFIITGNGNNTITTGAGNSFVQAGNQNNTITTGAGDSIINVGHGDNTITTGAGSNSVLAGDGDNTITTGAGNDLIYTGNGSNTVTAGAGDDTLVFAVNGANAVVNSSSSPVPTAGAENIIQVGGNSTYDGGSGFDTLVLALTRTQFSSEAMQSDLNSYLTFISAHTAANGEADAASFTFNSIGLTVSGVEKVAVDVVDGKFAMTLSLSDLTIQSSSSSSPEIYKGVTGQQDDLLYATLTGLQHVHAMS